MQYLKLCYLKIYIFFQVFKLECIPVSLLTLSLVFSQFLVVATVASEIHVSCHIIKGYQASF